MAREFKIPPLYKSDFVGSIKARRNKEDPHRRDTSPTIIEAGRVVFKLARHFGFCYGVQNAIEIAYRAVEENPDKRVFLLSEMIHNPTVNKDLRDRGVRFLRTTDGRELFPLSELTKDDIVIIPAFGTTKEIFDELARKGVDPTLYDTTCPFVEKVWKRARLLGQKGYTIVIHGKYSHEETRATFSHSQLHAPTIVIRDIEMAHRLAGYITGEMDISCFDDEFRERFSKNFDPAKHLQRLGVVNQTTMLAEETKKISEVLKKAIIKRWGADNIDHHFADTRDTLCYATTENQASVIHLVKEYFDFAVVVGGYNSSNTSHLVELFSRKGRVYHIKDSAEIIDNHRIRHLDIVSQKVKTTYDWLPKQGAITVAITAGASCPDAIVESVIRRIADLANADRSCVDEILKTA